MSAYHTIPAFVKNMSRLATYFTIKPSELNKIKSLKARRAKAIAKKRAITDKINKKNEINTHNHLIKIQAIACKEAAKQAKADAKLAAKQAKADAKLAAKQAKADAKLAAKQAKADAKLAAKQAKADAKLAAKQAKADAKLTAKQTNADAKQHNIVSKKIVKTDKKNAKIVEQNDRNDIIREICQSLKNNSSITL